MVVAITSLLLLRCAADGDDDTRYVKAGALDGLRPYEPEGGYVLPPATGRVCPPDGGGGMATADCGVSFERDVLGSVITRLGCGKSGCHALGGIEPVIDLGDASAARARLMTFVLAQERDATPRRFYVDPCATDPSRSSIACNLSGGDAASCGIVMPPSYAGHVTDEDRSIIVRWLACGAPAN